MPVFQLQPVHKAYVWGGQTLIEDFHMQTEASMIAESWTLSCHLDGESTLTNSGESLSSLLASHPAYVGKRGGLFASFPILVKLIDANRALSIQVHPNDEMGLALENEYGKTEMWYVLAAQPDAFLYFGFNQDMSQEGFRESISNNTILDKLNKVYVKPGDVFFVEAGLVHAIGAGIVIAEIQQSSNSTYRIYDYQRMGVDGMPRPLHIDKAVQAATLTKTDVSTLNLDMNQATPISKQSSTIQPLVSCPYFSVEKLMVEGLASITVDEESFIHLQVVEGEGFVIEETKKTPFRKGDSFFVSAGCYEIQLTGEATILLTRV